MSDPRADSQADAQPTPTTADQTHDQLGETIERDRHEERLAAAELPGDGDLFVAARVNDYDVPKLTTRAGGDLTRGKVNGQTDAVYSGGTSITREFDRVSKLDLVFDALVEKHDLEELTAGEEDA